MARQATGSATKEFPIDLVDDTLKLITPGMRYDELLTVATRYTNDALPGVLKRRFIRVVDDRVEYDVGIGQRREFREHLGPGTGKQRAFGRDTELRGLRGQQLRVVTGRKGHHQEQKYLADGGIRVGGEVGRRERAADK